VDHEPFADDGTVLPSRQQLITASPFGADDSSIRELEVLRRWPMLSEALPMRAYLTGRIRWVQGKRQRL
jgi:hypothetical protein